MIIVSVDLKKAFDAISMKALIQFSTDNPVPLTLQLALMRELIGPCGVTLASRGCETGRIEMTGGFRQGSPESSFLFSIILAHILQRLCTSWKSRGFGIHFGDLGGDRFSRFIFETDFESCLVG